MTDSGSGLFLVSGSHRPSTPPVRQRDPNIKNWAPLEVSASITTKGARMEPTRAMALTIPKAEFLMLVEKISLERM